MRNNKNIFLYIYVATILIELIFSIFNYHITYFWNFTLNYAVLFITNKVLDQNYINILYFLIIVFSSIGLYYYYGEMHEPDKT